MPNDINTTFDELVPLLEELRELIDNSMTPADESALLSGDQLDLSGQARPPRRALINLTLLSDCLRVAKAVIDADGTVSAAEIDYVYPLICRVATPLGRVRSEYAGYEYPDLERVPEFLTRYRDDAGLFGYGCSKTRWLGLEMCQQVSRSAGDGEPAELYRRLQTRLTDEICALSGVTPEQARNNARLREVLALRDRLSSPDVSDVEADDPRIAAFCSPRSPQVFSSISAPSQVWDRDPFDVETVHSNARDAFARIIDRATNPDRHGRGCMLLILGESGSGKTHLMRALRTYLHSRRLGYAGYMQLTTRSEDYSDYVLRNLIHSLDRAYDPPDVDSTGMMMLSNAIAEVRGAISEPDLRRLRDADVDIGPAADTVSPLVDALLGNPRFRSFDPDILRMFLYLQRRDPALNSRVFKFLRCEDLNPYDREMLGNVAPRTDGDSAQRTVEEIGRLMWSSSQGALVLLVDQLEDIQHLDKIDERFQRAVDVLRHITDHVRSAVVVLSCLDDLYTDLRQRLTLAACDRLERDPDRIQLSSRRTADEIEAIISRRLSCLYDEMDVRHRPDDPLFPIRSAELTKLSNQRIRDVLETCRQYHEACIDAGTVIEAGLGIPRAGAVETSSAAVLEQEWNDHLIASSGQTPTDDEALLKLLARGIDVCCQELGHSYQADCQQKGDLLHVAVTAPGTPLKHLTVGICNKSPQGGGLLRQIQALAKHAGDRIPVMVRCSEYPSRSKTRTGETIADLLRKGARRVVVEDSDWRTITALLDFRAAHSQNPGFADWLRNEAPLSQRRCFQELLDLDPLAARTAAVQPQAASPGSQRSNPGGVSGADTRAQTIPDTPTSRRERMSETRQTNLPFPTAPSDRRIALGKTRGLPARPVDIELQTFTTHAAFLGSTGSGKTTLALHIIEQALMLGIPAVLVDRKGDLCRYAQPDWWQEPAANPDLDARKQQFRDRVDVHLYTPGDPRGRNLTIPVIPAALAESSSLEQSYVARQAAAALAAMMTYRQRKNERSQEVILGKAIEILGQLVDTDVDASLEMLIDMLGRRDSAIVNAVGHLAKDKFFDKLVEDLETVKYARSELLGADGEQLDAATLLGHTPGRASGKARLNIISTKFLGEQPAVEFWVARLIVEITRWIEKHPSKTLQALLMFDEADMYMPAIAKPATKEPLQNLLKRARSAGLGVLLATQNPGDLDYRSRENILTWFVGRVTGERTIGKLKQLLSEYRMNAAGRLAKQNRGEFFLLGNSAVTELKSDRSIMATQQLPEADILKLARDTLG